MKSIFILLFTAAAFTCFAQKRYDVVVYGGTPGGVMAAVAAAREGASALLIEQTNHLGGLNSSGIGTAESEHMIEETISGLPLEFYTRVRDYLGKDKKLFYFESHIFERACNDFVREAGVAVRFGQYVTDVEKRERRIMSITLNDSARVQGTIFVDATYEGDLMARAGVSYTYGRESTVEYGETLAGIRFIDDPIDASPLGDDGQLLPGFVDREHLKAGDADNRVMNYNFRVTVSTNDDRRPFPKPDEYNPDRYVLLSRLLEHKPDTRLRDIIDIYAWQYPPGKYETNNKQKAVISLGHFGGNVGYPDATYDQRAAIYKDHKDWTLGLLYFLGHDERVPTPLREEVSQYGFAADEFTDNGNFPYYLYIREARRMKGALIQTQRDVLEERTKSDAICLGSHWIDSHHVQRVAISSSKFVNEGRIWEPLSKPYEFSYRTITPLETECVNLLVPVCLSVSHVAFCSARVECTWMQLGNSAGIAAAMASRKQIPVQRLNVNALQRLLKKREVIFSVTHQAWDGGRDLK